MLQKMLTEQGFFSQIRSAKKDIPDPQIQVFYNDKFANLMKQNNLPSVPINKEFANLNEAARESFKQIAKGELEGFVFASVYGAMKFEIESDCRETILELIEHMLKRIKADKDSLDQDGFLTSSKPIFGENTSDAKELFKKFYEIEQVEF